MTTLLSDTLIPDYATDRDIEIEADGTWPLSIHRFDAVTAAALRAAEAAGRPLLVRGAPGVGKSQTARAAAAFAGRPFLSLVIDGRTEADDLKWRFDAVGRLGDAASPGGVKPALRYVRPQALWWAYDWAGAQAQWAQALDAGPPPFTLPTAAAADTPPWQAASGRAVLLIDEIDKADPDLPNALLEVLANNGFTVPHGPAAPVRCSDATRPLVLITTNEERELPQAFLRRCLVVMLELPADPQALLDHLVQMGERHQQLLIRRRQRKPAERCTPPVLRAAAEQLAEARANAAAAGEYLPGTAEYLDLVRALATLYPRDAKEQLQQLGVLKQFALHKSLPGGG